MTVAVSANVRLFLSALLLSFLYICSSKGAAVAAAAAPKDYNTLDYCFKGSSLYEPEPVYCPDEHIKVGNKDYNGTWYCSRIEVRQG